MKVTIERSALQGAIGHASSVVERRTTAPVLSNVLIDAAKEAISFRATDLDVESISRASGEIERPGATTVPALILNEIVRKLPEGAQIGLEANAETARLEITAGRSHFSLATLPREDFPFMASAEYACNFTISAHMLRRLVDKARFAMSNEETRLYLNGLYLYSAERDGKFYLRAAATDGHRMARVEVECPPEAEGMDGVIIPRKTVGELHKLLEVEQNIVVSVSETKIRFATPEFTLTSKVVDGNFPDIERVIPVGNQKRLLVDAAEIASAVDRVAVISSERSRGVKFSLSEDRLVLSVQAPDAGLAEEEIAVGWDSEALEIGFNARFISEIMAQIERENAIIMLQGVGDQALITEEGDDSALYVVMPMRV